MTPRASFVMEEKDDDYVGTARLHVTNLEMINEYILIGILSLCRKYNNQVVAKQRNKTVLILICLIYMCTSMSTCIIVDFAVNAYFFIDILPIGFVYLCNF